MQTVIGHSFRWIEATAASLNDAAAAGAIVLVPLGAVEQHGPHLPTGTDGFEVMAVCERAAKILDHPVLVGPLLWLGLSEHHASFGGTITLSPSTFRAVLKDYVNSVAKAGFSRIVLVNGHGGNDLAMRDAVDEMGMIAGATVAAVTIWPLIHELARNTLDQNRGIMHSCEGETSMMLALAPERVDLSQLEHAIECPAFTPLPPSQFHIWREFRDVTQSGVRGDARRANAAKGEVLLDGAANALAAGVATLFQ